MNINATLLVQIINFFIVYVVLRVLFFKPVVAIIEGEQEEQKKIHAVIARNRVLIEQSEKSGFQQWKACRDFYFDMQPSIVDAEQYVLRNIASPIEYPVVSGDLVNKLIESTTILLTKKVSEL